MLGYLAWTLLGIIFFLQSLYSKFSPLLARLHFSSLSDCVVAFMITRPVGCCLVKHPTDTDIADYTWPTYPKLIVWYGREVAINSSDRPRHGSDGLNKSNGNTIPYQLRQKRGRRVIYDSRAPGYIIRDMVARCRLLAAHGARSCLSARTQLGIALKNQDQ